VAAEDGMEGDEEEQEEEAEERREGVRRNFTAAEQAQIDAIVNQMHTILARSLDRSIDIFLKGDVDKSQLIERREFHLALSTLGVDASTAAADLTFDFFDEDHNGSIDYRELHKKLRRATSGLSFHEAWRSPPAMQAITRLQAHVRGIKGRGMAQVERNKKKQSTDEQNAASKTGGAAKGSSGRVYSLTAAASLDDEAIFLALA